MKAKTIIVIFVSAVAMFVLPSITKAQTLTPNDGTFEYIKILDDGLAIKLTDLGLQYAWTGSGAKQIAERVKYLGERANRVCYNIKVNKLAKEIRKHALAYKAHILRRRANPVNVSWQELR